LLPRVLLPVGELSKDEVRRIAREEDLPVHDKPDSQEICFVPDDDYLGFVRARRPDRGETSGPIVDESGREVGRHGGFEGFTIGQRRGVGIAFGEPRYVVQIEPASRTVAVGPRASLERPGLVASRFNWHVEPPMGPVRCLAQIRARHRAVPATAEPIDGHPETVRVHFDSPQTAVTPGQVVTLYQGDVVLGGGWIERAVGEQDDDRG
jgi:tRNA-specific 2-thiouridylase